MEAPKPVLDKNSYDYVLSHIDSFPTVDQIKYVKSRSWWMEYYDIVNEYLDFIMDGTQLIPTTSDQIEVKNMIKLKKIIIKIPMGNQIIYRLGISEDAYDSCLNLMKDKNDLKLYAGFALEANGFWKHHYWCEDSYKNITETMGKKIVYIPVTHVIKKK